MNTTTYGLGGYDPEHPNGNIVEQVVDNGDGTGVRTLFDADGNVTSTENLTGLPIPPEPEPDPVEALQAQVAELTAALNALLGD